MRWVDRGPAPSGVAFYENRYTQKWIRYYRHRIGGRPSQHNYWTVFAPDLRERFKAKCGYCEQRFEPVGELSSSVDHFRPLHHFPHLAFAWDNWISSCQRCNSSKDDQWPDTGYVDPCAADFLERPEEYFDYAHLSGEIVAKQGLTPASRRKAENTIDDLQLNETRLRESRFRLMSSFVQDLMLSNPGPDRLAVVSRYQEPSQPHSGVVAMFAERLRRSGII